jgi:hypothetical protein
MQAFGKSKGLDKRKGGATEGGKISAAAVAA